MVKALIHYGYKEVFAQCKIIPSLNKSSLLKNEKWILESRDQEYLTPTKFRPLSKIDVVWFFRHHDPRYSDVHKYRIIHEIKTGRYDIDEIFNKYYSGMETQIWIWGWHKFNAVATPTDPKCVAKVKQGLVKTADIEFLVPMICPYLKRFYDALDGDVWCASI